jgi:glycosyltransferase involved in cell wall biosynthesis
MKARILMVAPQPFFQPRGTPFSVKARIEALLSLGHTVDLVTYPIGDDPGIPGLTIVRSPRPFWIRSIPIGPSGAKAVLDVLLFFTLLRRLMTRPYDLLFTHEEASFMALPLAPLFKLPHLYDMHSLLSEQLANFDFANWRPMVALFAHLERRVARSAAAIIAICPALGESARTMAPRTPLAVIENTWDVGRPPEFPAEAVRELAVRIGTAGSPFTAVYTGTFEPYQGIDLLLDGWRIFTAGHPAARLVLVGGAPPHQAAVEALTERLGLAASVRVLPRCAPQEVHLYQALADTLVSTRSRGVNTPLKIYQALWSGRPILATDISSHTQCLDPETALLVPPTPEGVADGLARLAADPALRESLGQAARAAAEESYNRDVYLAKLRAIVAMGSGLANEHFSGESDR